MLISISRAFATAATFAPLILAAPTTTTPQQTAGNFKYSGCYADVSSRVLKTKTMAINNLTLEKCAAFCYSYALFGVESGYECFCGNSFIGSPALRPDSECMVDTCVGNKAETCGGDLRLQVYSKATASSSTQTTTSSTTKKTTSSSTTSIVPKSSTTTKSVVTSTMTRPTSKQTSSTTSKTVVIAADAPATTSPKTSATSKTTTISTTTSKTTTTTPKPTTTTSKTTTTTPKPTTTTSKTTTTTPKTTTTTSKTTTTTPKPTTTTTTIAKPTTTTTLKTTTTTTTSKPTTTTTTTKAKTTTTTSKTTTTTTTTTSKAAATSTTSSGKRGVAYNSATLANLFAGQANTQVTWGYNWYSASNGLSSSLEFVPMLWSNASDLTSVWSANVATAISAGSTHVLGFNEPDLYSQADMTVAEAVTAWRKYMEPLAGKVKLGAPAVTNGGSPMGLTWLANFLTACTGCTIDYVPIHWYDSATNLYYFKNYIKEAYATAGRPIWITEFEGYGTQAQQIAMLEAVMPWLDSLSYVERYSWFGVFDQNLVTNGALNALGEVYMTYTNATLNSIFAS